MSCKDCECLEDKIKALKWENASLRHMLHKYADELEKRQNTTWMVEELIRRCPLREMNVAELVVYTKPEAVQDWKKTGIGGDQPLHRIQLEEIKVCFYFNKFRK